MKIHLKFNSTVWRPTRIFFLLASLAIAIGSCASSQQYDEGTANEYQNYVPPPWAPPYDNVSSVRYYYMPDYEMYYDVWNRQFWYIGPDGQWIPSHGPPLNYADVDLNGAFIVLIDRDIDRPWERHEYYRDNYPRHGYDHYKDIVIHNRIVTNIEPGHELVPRAFNENNNRVTFMQRPNQPEGGIGESRSGQPPPGQPAPSDLHRGEQPPQGGQHPVPQVPTILPHPPPANYHHVVHEVPMRNISLSMPQESRKFNYGNGYTKGSVPAPRPAAPAPSRGNAPSGGGGKK